MEIVILGAGLVGTPIALDLQKDGDNKVVLADRDEHTLARAKANGIACVQIDLMVDGAIEYLVKDADFVVNALPGKYGFSSLRRLIEAGKSGVDIAFYPEDYRVLEPLVAKHKVTWVVDMGVAPGMSNLLAAFGSSQLKKTDDIKIYVGGLPKDKSTFWQYKAPFSPSDVIEEYTRRARFVRNGEIVSMPALTEREILSFPIVGDLEAFNSDGLRSLMWHLDVPNMIEKTLRYPGHIEKIEVLKEAGFFSEEKIMLHSKAVKPLDVSSALLFDQWQLLPGDREFTVMQIRASGINEQDEHQTIVYDLYDEYDPISKIHSMARTTGYTASVVLRQLMLGNIKGYGIFAPEMLAHNADLVEDILAGLADRGVVYHKTLLDHQP